LNVNGFFLFQPFFDNKGFKTALIKTNLDFLDK